MLFVYYYFADHCLPKLYISPRRQALPSCLKSTKASKREWWRKVGEGRSFWQHLYTLGLGCSCIDGSDGIILAWQRLKCLFLPFAGVWWVPGSDQRLYLSSFALLALCLPSIHLFVPEVGHQSSTHPSQTSVSVPSCMGPNQPKWDLLTRVPFVVMVVE